VGNKKRGWRRKHLRQRRDAEREETLNYERAQKRFKQWVGRHPTAEEHTPRDHSQPQAIVRTSLDT